MDGRVAEHRVTAGCDQRQLEDSQPADEAAQVLTRNRSFKSKQLVRSQAIRESQSPPRLPSPLIPASPEHLNKQGAEPPQPNITYNNSKSDIVVSSSEYSNVSLNSCVSSFNSDLRSDANRVVCARMATNSSQNDTQKISGRNLRMDGAEEKCQQAGTQRPVEIQITSGTWDSMVYEEDDASILQESGVDENGGGGSTTLASRMECVCGHCEDITVKIGANSGICPDCQGRIRIRTRCCPAKQDSGVGCCSDECPDCASEQSEADASMGSELLSSIHRSTRVSSGNGDSKQDSPSAEDDTQGSDDGQYEQGPFCKCQVKNGHQIQRNDSEESKLEPQGAELVRFIRCTLNKNRRDRIVLLKIERELATLVNDTSRCTAKFPAMSSYHRMLVHRCAALFGLKHLLDPTSRLAVIVTKTGTTGGRIPCTGFRQWCSAQFPVSPGRYQQDMPQAKSILKRDTHSLDEALSGPAGAHAASARSKSFEQREEEYERVRRRIFSGDEAGNGEEMNWPWLQEGGRPQPPVKLLTPDCGITGRQNRLLKVQSLETREPPSVQAMRAAVSKSHSFGGYGGTGGDRCSPPGLAGPPSRILSRQGDLASSSWRLSPSSSGYKTLSLRSTDSITPSPTEDHTPEPVFDAAQPTAPVLWAVTDMSAIPPGALIIHPQTGQPLTNADGSMYYYDPARPPRLPPHNTGVPLGSTQNGIVNTIQDKKNEWVAEKRRGRLEKQNSINASDFECPNSQDYQKNCCQQQQHESENYQQYCAECPQPGDQDLQYANMQKPSVIVTDSIANVQNVDSKPSTIMSKGEIENNNNNYQMDSGYTISSGFDGKSDETMYNNVSAQFCQQEYEGGPHGYKGSETVFQERKEGEGMVQYSVYYHHSNGGFQQPNAPDFVDGQNQVYRGNDEQVVQNAPGMFCVPENETNLPLTALQIKASQYQPAGLVPHNPQMYPADVDVMRQQVAMASGAMLYTGVPPATNFAQQPCRIDPSLPQLYNPGVGAQTGSEQQQQQQPPAAPKPSLSPEAGGCGQHYGPCLVDPTTGLLHCQRPYPLVFPADQLGTLPRAYQHSAGMVSAAPAPAQALPAHLHAFTYPSAAHWSPSWPTVLQPPPCGTPGPKPMTPPAVYMQQPDLGLTQQTYHTLPSLYQYQPGYTYQAYPTAVIPQVFTQPYPICQPLYHSNAITPEGRQSTGVPNNFNNFTDVTSTLMQQHQTNNYYNQNRRNSHSGVKNYDSYKNSSKFNDNSTTKNYKSGGFGASGSISGSSRTTPLGGQFTPPVTVTDVTFVQHEQIDTERNRNNTYTFNNKTYYHNNMMQSNNVTSSYISPFNATDHHQSYVNNDNKYISNVKKNEGLISPRHYHKSIAAARNANHQNMTDKNGTNNFDPCSQYRTNATNAFVVTNDVNARRKAFRNNSGRSQNSAHRQDLHSQRIAMENIIKSFTETRLNQNTSDQKAENPNDVHQRFAVLQKSYSVDGTPPPVGNSNLKGCQRMQSSGGGAENVDSGNNGKAHNQGEAPIPNHVQSDCRPNPTGAKPFCNKYNSRPASSDSTGRTVVPSCGTPNQVYVDNYSTKVNGHVGCPPNGNSRTLPKEDQNHESNKKVETPHQTVSSSTPSTVPPSKNTATASSGNTSPNSGASNMPTQMSSGVNNGAAGSQSEKDDRLAQVETPSSKSNTSTPPQDLNVQAQTYNNTNTGNNSYGNKQPNQEYHPPVNYRGPTTYSSYGAYRPNSTHSYGRPAGSRSHQQNAHAAIHNAPPHPPPAQPVMQHLQNLSLQYGRQFLFARQMSAGWSRRSPGPVPTGFTSHLRYNGPRGPRYNSHGQHRR